MSAQGDCDFLVKRARELVTEDPWAAKAWLITARTLYPTDFSIQYEMYIIERNAERTSSAGRLLYDIFINFPDQPVVWREITVITAALRNDSQDKHALFLKGVFETLPGQVQCQMLLKATEQCFNTLEKAEMLLLLLKRFPESVVQHGVSLGESLLEAENVEDLDTPVNCFRKLFVCDVLPLIINNMEMRLPASLLHKYMHKAAEFYIGYVTRGPGADTQIQPSPEVTGLKSPGMGRGQRYVIDGLSEKSSVVTEPWERLLEIVGVVGARCEWQGEKGSRTYTELLQRVKELCRYLPGLEGETLSRCCSQIVTCSTLVLFRSAHHYISTVQPSLFQGHNALGVTPWVLLEDLSSVFNDVEMDRSSGKHAHKKRKLADGREKPMSSDDEDALGKGRGRHILVNKVEMPGWAETLEHFRTARESWDLLHSHDALESEFNKICMAWKTESWLWFRIFLTDMIIYQGHYRKALSSLVQLSALQPQQNQNSLSATSNLETHRALIQQASCHYALGEHRLACEKVLEVVSGLVPQNQEPVKPSEEQGRVRNKPRKGNDLRLIPCTSKDVLPFCLQLMLACFKLRAFSDSGRDDLALGHVIVLLQHDWPQGEALFLKAVDRICEQGSFQYENFFNYVTNIDMLEEFAYLRTTEGGRVQLELLPNQGMLIKHHTVTRGITKGVKEDFRLAMERQVSRCGENLLNVLHRFCINEKIILIQSLP
ncbi:integrator complex subunit 10 isoform X2 [Astyanax mexicanus]|uniref:integrator complex subunit 10 isoform X2 n=1 Tax=Astyanax mexicanus TaxID=7994 RepID=UPI000440EBAC|nr:integrator complex subunit 10 isoform X2 [Astyanax mexicanus]